MDIRRRSADVKDDQLANTFFSLAPAGEKFSRRKHGRRRGHQYPAAEHFPHAIQPLHIDDAFKEYFTHDPLRHPGIQLPYRRDDVVRDKAFLTARGKQKARLLSDKTIAGVYHRYLQGACGKDGGVVQQRSLAAAFIAAAK
ncbi:hypothetical protein SDC9_131430 [bioreactor metagenome]|uniref:Uncharacterized protein n=1 Tax=bioreactor metagenome TaxID=1076179 RepID=A0A645D560_9ZZZZ